MSNYQSQIILCFVVLSLTGSVTGSVTCSLAGEGGCKWSCRLRGYIKGDCLEDGGGGTQCSCTQTLSVSNIMDYFTEKLSQQYPDTPLITHIVTDVIKHHNRTCLDSNSGDGKWRPLPLLLGILYKIQDKLESSINAMKNVQSFSVDEDKEDVLSLLGHYWNLIRAADTSIRYTDHQENENNDVNITWTPAKTRSRREYADILGVPEEQVVWIWSSQTRNNSNLSEYIPEHMITVDPKQRTIILTLLGTKVFPAPQPLDIMMDLLGTAENFLDGVAHGGISIGTRNLVKTAVPVIRRELESHPSFSLLILGYSLGAGLAQLLALDCQLGLCSQSLPPDTVVRTVAFGSPPVFAKPGEEPPVLDNVFIVQNNKDGISGASLRNIYDVLSRACLVHSLNIKRRNLLKLLFSEVETEEDKHLIHFEDDDKERVDYDFHDEVNEGTDIWMRIKGKLETYISQVEEPKLHHLGRTFLVLQKSDDSTITIENYQGFQGTEKFACELSLQGSMLSDHMPDAYNHLFEEYQHINRTNKILHDHLLDNLVHKSQKEGFRSKLKKKFSKFLDLFNGIGK